MTLSRLEIRLEPHSGIRRLCFFCKSESNKDTFIAAVYVDDIFSGYVVCPTCQAVTHPVRAEALRSEAAYLREQADELEAMADEIIVVPRPEAVRRARDARVMIQ